MMTRTKQLREKVKAKRQQQTPPATPAAAASAAASAGLTAAAASASSSASLPLSSVYASPPSLSGSPLSASPSLPSASLHHADGASAQQSAPPAAVAAAAAAAAAGSASSSASSSVSASSDDTDVKLFLDGARLGLLDHIASLLETGHITAQHVDQAFLIAAEHGHQRLLALLLPKISSLLARTARGDSAVHLAAARGHYDIVSSLVKAGCPLDERNADGQTPLYVAADNNQAHVVALLLESGAAVNSSDHSGNSVLHVACGNGYAPIVLILVKSGAGLSAVNDKDETPLEASKNSEICRILLEHNATTAAAASPQLPASHSASASLSAPETSPHILSPHLATPASPFRELPAGASSFLFWTAMGVGKDSYMFQNFGVFPFDRLNDTERIIVLTEVAEAMSGYKPDLRCNLLNESALYAVFALMKARIKAELEAADLPLEADGDDGGGGGSESVVWRRRVLQAYEQVYGVSGSACGLSVDCYKRTVWNTVVNLLARSLFGEAFWEKKRMFLSPNGIERASLVRRFRLDAAYFSCRLPNTASVEIQLTFKKLITMSKTFLSDDSERQQGRQQLQQPAAATAVTAAAASAAASCFCNECINELQVPLTFKLQFLEEAAAEKRKNKKGRKGGGGPGNGQNGTAGGSSSALATTAVSAKAGGKGGGAPSSASSAAAAGLDSSGASDPSRSSLDSLVLTQRKELKNFFCFPQSDHELLTDAGFRSFEQVNAALQRPGGRIRVACPVQVSAGQYRLEYRSIGKQQLIAQRHTGQLVSLRSASSGVDLTVTSNHRLLVRTGSEVQLGAAKWRIAAAGDVAACGQKQAQLLCAASHGAAADSPHLRLPVSAPLGLSSADQEDAFLELYAHWLRDGWLRVRAPPAVRLRARRPADVRSIDALLARLPLVLVDSDGSNERRGYTRCCCGSDESDAEGEEEMDEQEAGSRSGNQCSGEGAEAEQSLHHAVQYSIYEPAWWRCFSRQYGQRSRRPARATRAAASGRLGVSRAFSPSSGTSASDDSDCEDEQDAAAAHAAERLRPSSPTSPFSAEPAECRSSESEDEDASCCCACAAGCSQWLWAWVWTRLDARRLRLLLSGLRRDRGEPSLASGAVCTSCVLRRDEYQHLCIRAGFSAVFSSRLSRKQPGSPVRRIWTVSWSALTDADAVSLSQPALWIGGGQAEVRQSALSSALPVWCVTVPTADHLIVVRRVTAVSGSGCALAASRPVLVSNSSISVEEKWGLTEMSTTELSELISAAAEWETLRAALDSYAKYAWEEDVLEISDECFPEADTRILTERGFLSLSEIEQRTAGGDRLRFACYERSSRSLRYCAGRLYFPSSPPAQLLAFNSAGEAGRWAVAEQEGKDESGSDGQQEDEEAASLSLRVTPSHRMLVQASDGSVSVVRASELLSQSRCAARPVRMLAVAEGGHAGSEGMETQALQSALQLEDSQWPLFLELLGFWLARGSASQSAVSFALEKEEEEQRRWLEQTVLQLADPSLVSVSEQPAVVISISDSNWAALLHHASAPAADSPQPVRLIPHWAIMGLSPAELRRVVLGLWRSDGSWTIDEHNGCKRRCILTSFDGLREQLMQALLHCGYSPLAELLQADNRWMLSWSTPAVATERPSCWPQLSLQQGVTSQAYRAEQDGRIWCVQVSHADHLVVAQRVQRAAGSGRIVRQSRPVVTGNCVTIADDMCEDGKGMNDMLEAMLDAVDAASRDEQTRAAAGAAAPAAGAHHHHAQHPPHHHHHHHHSHHHPASASSSSSAATVSSPLSDEEWDKRGRQMLESCVLAEFARKIAAQYLLKKQESRAQQVALELELELMQEEEMQQQQQAGKRGAAAAAQQARDKKKKKKSAKDKKRTAGTAAAANASRSVTPRQDEDDDDEDEDRPEDSETSRQSAAAEQANSSPSSSPPPSAVSSPSDGLLSAAAQKERELELERQRAKDEERKREAAKKRSKKQNSTVTTLDRMLASSSKPSSIRQPQQTQSSAQSSASASASSSPSTSLPSSTIASPSSAALLAAKAGRETRATAAAAAAPATASGLDSNPFAMLDEQDASRRQQRTEEETKTPDDGDQSATLSASSSATDTSPPASAAAGEQWEDGLLLPVSKESYAAFLKSRQVPLPRQHAAAARHLKAGSRTAVFLLNTADRLLHGAFCCTALMGDGLSSSVLSRGQPSKPSGSAGCSSLLELQLTDELEPLPEPAWRHLLTDGIKARKLELRQVRDIVALAKASRRPQQQQSGRQAQAAAKTLTAAAALLTSGAPQSASSGRQQQQQQQRPPARSAALPTAGSAVTASPVAPSPEAASKSSAAAAPSVHSAAVTAAAGSSAVKNVWKLRQEQQKASEHQSRSAAAAAAAQPPLSGSSLSLLSPAVSPPSPSLPAPQPQPGLIINPTITIIPTSLQGSSWQSSAQRAAAIVASPPPPAAAAAALPAVLSSTAAAAFSPSSPPTPAAASAPSPAASAAPVTAPFPPSWSSIAAARSTSAGSSSSSGSSAELIPASPPSPSLAVGRTVSPLAIVTARPAQPAAAMAEAMVEAAAPAWLSSSAFAAEHSALASAAPTSPWSARGLHDDLQQQQAASASLSLSRLVVAPLSASVPSSPRSAHQSSYEAAFESAAPGMRTPPISPMRAAYSQPSPHQAQHLSSSHALSSMPPSPSNRALFPAGIPPLHPAALHAQQQRQAAAAGAPAAAAGGLLLFAQSLSSSASPFVPGAATAGGGYGGRTPSPHPPVFAQPPPHAAQQQPHAFFHSQSQSSAHYLGHQPPAFLPPAAYQHEEQRRQQAAAAAAAEAFELQQRDAHHLLFRGSEEMAEQQQPEMEAPHQPLRRYHTPPSQLQHTAQQQQQQQHYAQPRLLHSHAHAQSISPLYPPVGVSSSPSLVEDDGELAVAVQHLDLDMQSASVPQPSSASLSGKSGLSALWSGSSSFSSSTGAAGWGGGVWSSPQQQQPHQHAPVHGLLNGQSGGPSRADDQGGFSPFASPPSPSLSKDPWALKDSTLFQSGGWAVNGSGGKTLQQLAAPGSGGGSGSLLSSLPSIPNSYGSIWSSQLHTAPPASSTPPAAPPTPAPPAAFSHLVLDSGGHELAHHAHPHHPHPHAQQLSGRLPLSAHSAFTPTAAPAGNESGLSSSFLSSSPSHSRAGSGHNSSSVWGWSLTH